MPPKRAGRASITEKKQIAGDQRDIPSRNKEQEQATDEVAANVVDNHAEQAGNKHNHTSSKRKSPPTDTGANKPPKKEPRQGNRSSSRSARNTDRDITSRQILNFLLSKDSIGYCYPDDELNAARSGKFKKTYSLTPPSLFTPFEHLITAHLFSKPLSHVLGMRSIRTLLNDPFNFSTPEAVKTAGEKKVWEALETARTQHRQKTAAYITEMGIEYAPPQGTQGDSDVMLELAMEANEGGPKATIAHLKNTIKGLGETGGQIFCRRVQACEGWGEAIWPYADPRSIEALRECGVKVASADELQSMIEKDVDWDRVGDMGLIKEKEGVDAKDYEVQVATEFVTVLERAIGCQLEHNTSDLKRAAAQWT